MDLFFFFSLSRAFLNFLLPTMPYLTTAPPSDSAGGSKMPPGTSGRQYPSAFGATTVYPFVTASDVLGGSSSSCAEATTAGAATPHLAPSPLRCPYTSSGGGNSTSNSDFNNNGYSGGGGDRAVCYVSHHNSATSFGYCGGSGAINHAALDAGVAGASHLNSCPSTELQEYISLTSPSSDFYYYSPQPFYLESPAPCAAAELYGGSPRSASFASNPPLPPPSFAPYYHNSNGGGVDSVNAAAASPSLKNSMGMSGSRFPQWYLPRGLYGSFFSAGAVPSGMYGRNASTPVSVAAAEDVLSGEENTAAVPRCAPGPFPPRLNPQPNPSVVNPLTLPPSVVGSARSSFAPVLSPTFRRGRPAPFVPYDGRAYGLPVFRAISCTEAAVAIAHSALASETTAGGSNHHHHSGNCGGHAQTRSAVRRESQAATMLSPALRPSADVGSDKKRRDLAEKDTATAGLASSKESPAVTPAAAGAVDRKKETATGDAVEDEESYSPREKALLVDAHICLARLRAEAQVEQQRTRSAHFLPTTTTASAEAGHAMTAPTAVADRTKPLRESVHASESSEETEIPVSPIPHHLGSDTAHLEDSSLEEAEPSQRQIAEAEAVAVASEVDTRALLEQVLSVRGVKWRHDPYSRRVLVRSTGHSSGEEGSGSEGHIRTPLLPASAPATPRAQLHHCPSPGDVVGRKGHTPDGAGVASSDSGATLTQPPDSTVASLHSQTSHDHSSSTIDNAQRSKAKPSARRMPIKKVCVRHFVSGGEGGHCVTAESVVGLLATVVTPAPQSTAAMPTKKEQRSGAVATAEEEVAPSTPMQTLPPPPSTPSLPPVQQSLSCPEKTREMVHRSRPVRKTHVPPPRSKQPCGDAGGNHAVGGVDMQPTAAAPPTSQSATSDTSNSSATSFTITGCDGGHGQFASPSPMNDPVVKQVGRLAAAPSTARVYAPIITATATATATVISGKTHPTSWAWRARLSRGLAPADAATACPTSPSVKEVSKEGILTALASWANTEVFSTAELDTSLLVQLWHQLNSSGCFTDVFEARKQKLGADSNNSANMAARYAMRRYSGCPGTGVPSMLTTAEVTHVFLLRHRYRTSCAVAACYYECGTEVVVDGDMGVDTGVVVQVMTKAEYLKMSLQERRLAGFTTQLEEAVTSSIHRVIRADEAATMAAVQRPLEDATLAFVRFLATQPHLFCSCRIDCMNFVDVEFQADGQKLYVFYQTSSVVRFLELATFLNHVFHCRIWMKLAKGY